MKTNFNFQRLVILFFAIFCVVFIILGLKTNAVTEDYWLAAYVVKKGVPFFSPFMWVFNQYKEWSGQIIVNFLQGFFTVSPAKTNFISALHAALFLGTVLFWSVDNYKKYEGDRASRFMFGIAQFLCVFTATYSILGEAVYLAASPYIWSFIFFVLGHEILKSDFFSKYTWMRYFVFFALGNSSEFLLLPTLFLFWRSRKNESMTHFKKYIAVFFVGAFVNILSPGLLTHLKGGLTSISFNPIDQLWHLQIVGINALRVMGPRILYIIPFSFFIQMSSSMNLSDLKEMVVENFGLALSSVLILVPVLGPAADGVYFFFLIFAALTIFWFVQYLKRRFAHFRIPVLIHNTALLVALTIDLAFLGANLMDAIKIRKSFLLQIEEIESLTKHHLDFSINPHKDPMPGHILYYSDITDDIGSPNNLARTEYYGVESIVAK